MKLKGLGSPELGISWPDAKAGGAEPVHSSSLRSKKGEHVQATRLRCCFCSGLPPSAAGSGNSTSGAFQQEVLLRAWDLLTPPQSFTELLGCCSGLWQRPALPLFARHCQEHPCAPVLKPAAGLAAG